MECNNKKKDAPEQIARLSIDLLATDHKRLKTVASLMGMTMKDLVVVSIGDFMQHRLSQVSKSKAKAVPQKSRSKVQARKR